MKAFHFRLESALRWRGAQVDIERNRAAAAAASVSEIRSSLESRRRQFSSVAADIANGSSGEMLQAWSGWSKKSDKDIGDLEAQARSAEKKLAGHMANLVEANRNEQLLRKLKQNAHLQWNTEAARELEAFVSETFLRQVTIGKRKGA